MSWPLRVPHHIAGRTRLVWSWWDGPPIPQPTHAGQAFYTKAGRKPLETQSHPHNQLFSISLWGRQVQVLNLPRAMRSTLMIRMMVGLMGSEALTSISSSVMPMMDRSTIARSSWFHLENGKCSSLSRGKGYGGGCHGGTEN